jgi:hypothetical protein
MECEYSSAGEADSLTKNGPKSAAELLHIVQNLIPNGVSNIQRMFQALKQTVYVFSQEFSCAHQGEADIKRHVLNKVHNNRPSSPRQQPLFHKTIF